MAVERFLPTTLGQAMELCRKHRDEAKIIGGGTDLVIRIKKGVIQPRVLISLEKVRELRFISYEKDSGLVMGSMTTAADLEKSELVREKAEVLCTAAGTLGNPLIRRSATIGGNLCNAAPSADLAPVCLVLGARLKVMGLEGEREIGIDDFFKGPGQTALAPGELLTRIIFPPLPPKAKAVYLKASRSRGADLALVGVAVMTEIEGIRIKDIKIALGAVAPTPVRATGTEAALIGRELTDELLEDICVQAVSEACCISDIRCSAEYRNKLIPVLVKRAVRQSAQAA